MAIATVGPLLLTTKLRTGVTFRSHVLSVVVLIKHDAMPLNDLIRRAKYGRLWLYYILCVADLEMRLHKLRYILCQSTPPVYVVTCSKVVPSFKLVSG